MHVKTLILGAGAAGMFCAVNAGPGTLVVDHAKTAGEKIRISGGGRCNFTNIYTDAENFLSQNTHFAKSALSRYGPWDFVALVDQYGIAWHEKTLGQLFCDVSAKDIIAMLRTGMIKAGADLWLETTVGEIRHDGRFHVQLARNGQQQVVTSDALVVATGGKSIPKMGATGLAYQVARQFGLRVTDTSAALVPFTFSDERFKPLAGVSANVRATAGGVSFDEAMLFTHRGLSGPAILQASSYWTEGNEVVIDLLPDLPLYDDLRAQRRTEGRKALRTILTQHLPGRLVDHLAAALNVSGNIGDQSDAALASLCDALHNWSLTPAGTEGYRTAEVTLGGVDTDDLNARTMEAKDVPGLFFIGECVDVTGWLGGYNFQWAWASGYAAAQTLS